MCSFCGLLGGPDHWMDARSKAGGFNPSSDAASRRRHRSLRLIAANRLLKPVGLELKDWNSDRYLLSNGRGRVIVLQDMAQLCAAAEQILDGPIDPLSPGLLERMEKSS